MSTNVTITGRLGGDPELRFTPQGKAVASLSLVSSKSTKLPNGDWEESETTWYRVTVWDAMAENVAESLTKGDSVIVVGRLFMDNYTDKMGQERQSLKVNAYNVGPDLKRAPWRKNAMSGGTSAAPARVNDDPWSTPADDVPPF